MKPERVVIVLTWLLLAAGFVAWGVGGAPALRGTGMWLWLGAASVLSLPLLLWATAAIVRAFRR